MEKEIKIENKILLEKLIEFCKENKLEILKFELVANYSAYDIRIVEKMK